MPTPNYTKRFHRSFKKLAKGNPTLKEKTNGILVRFAQNPNHPSLHLEKLSGTDTWTIRIDRGNRLFFVWSDTGDTAIFFFIGAHDAYRRVGK